MNTTNSHYKKIYKKYYKKYYNKYYNNKIGKEHICVPHSDISFIQTTKTVQNKNILKMKELLVKHNIVNDMYSTVPDSLILDLYAMLSDQKCLFNIKQF
mgnify:FL=1